MGPRPRPGPCSRCDWSLTAYDDDGDIACHRCGHVTYVTAPLPFKYDGDNKTVTPGRSDYIRRLAVAGYTYLEIAQALGLGKSTVRRHIRRSPV